MDGATRDVAKIREMNFPVFARDTSVYDSMNRQRVVDMDVPVQIGFNRRFDPSHRKVALAAQNGEIGALEQVLISSRDPEPPPKEYYLVAGGMLRDMTIHDFDLARFVLNEEVEKVTALSATLFDPVAREIGEIDSVMILMQTESGKLCHINNSRHASYGYDQRLEAHGSKGMIRSENHEWTTVEPVSYTHLTLPTILLV